MSIIGMVGDELSIRELNVEFDSVEKKQTFMGYLKIVIEMY